MIKQHNSESKKAIIFDLGGVVIDLDINCFYKTLKSYNKNVNTGLFTYQKQNSIFHEYEMGKLTDTEFLKYFSAITNIKKPIAELKNIWCKMIKGISKDTVDTLTKLSKKRDIFALSNTNPIHIDFIDSYLFEYHQISSINSFFKNIYLSYQGKHRKPDINSFLSALTQFKLTPEQAIFIDDVSENVEAATAIGMKSILKPREKTLNAFLISNGLL